MNRKKVFVSGCFDLLHSGHVAFLENANQFGDVYVCIGSDNTIKKLKNAITSLLFRNHLPLDHFQYHVLFHNPLQDRLHYVVLHHLMKLYKCF